MKLERTYTRVSSSIEINSECYPDTSYENDFFRKYIASRDNLQF